MVSPTLPPATEPYRVRFVETDLMGVVYHGNLFTYFEMGRLELLRHRGVNYKEVSGEGINLAVVKGEFHYRTRISYDDELVTHCKAKDIGHSTLTFIYEIVRGQEVVATGLTRHCCVNSKGEPIALPDNLRQALCQDS